ncbi:MAG: hypothetical protein M3N45_14800 [Actinomycetota bacterium]|nr:hypothetical protein [Actinomycetota bacterium]
MPLEPEVLLNVRVKTTGWAGVWKPTARASVSSTGALLLAESAIDRAIRHAPIRHRLITQQRCLASIPIGKPSTTGRPPPAGPPPMPRCPDCIAVCTLRFVLNPAYVLPAANRLRRRAGDGFAALKGVKGPPYRP